MKRITFNKRSRHELLHIEAPGCIVNIRLLADASGAPVTSVEVLANGACYAGDPQWWIEGKRGDFGRHIRVVRKEGNNGD